MPTLRAVPLSVAEEDHYRRRYMLRHARPPRGTLSEGQRRAVEKWRYLANHLARKVDPGNADDFEDSVAESHVVMCKAALRYTASLGTAPSTFFGSSVGFHLRSVSRDRVAAGFAGTRGLNRLADVLRAIPERNDMPFGVIQKERAEAPGDEWEAVIAAVAKLPHRLLAVLTWRFADSLTLTEIGRRMGLSKERVRQLETEAIARVRAACGEGGG